jgi:3-mercaptopyruvate sulfurtransferase SseA
MVAERMKNFGFENLFIFTGGWEVWTKERGES